MSARAEAAAGGADLVLAPELVVSGYPPEDLVLKPAFQDACRQGVEKLAAEHLRTFSRLDSEEWSARLGIETGGYVK